MAEVRTWDHVYDQFIEIAGTGDYQAALALLNEEREHFPENQEATDYYRLCMTARVAPAARVFEMLQSKLDADFWYGEHILRASPSLGPLQGNPEFERLVALHTARQQSFTPEHNIAVLEPTGASAPLPAMIALHGNMSNHEEAAAAWAPVADQGRLIGVPLSSQLIWKGTAVWDDYETARRDAKAAFDNLSATHGTDPHSLILGGFSMGGETAIRITLDGSLPARGFIALGPGGPSMENPEQVFAPLLASATEHDLRGYIILGESDTTIPQQAIHRLIAMLNEAGIPCGHETLPGVAHAYPTNFSEIIARALAFVAQ
jgi:dienelactone hydrolase